MHDYFISVFRMWLLWDDLFLQMLSSQMGIRYGDTDVEESRTWSHFFQGHTVCIMVHFHKSFGYPYTDGLAQDCSNSSALAMELL